MFKIRLEQQEALEQAEQKNFERVVAQDLREVYPDALAAYSNDALEKFVHESLEEAEEEYELESRGALVTFAFLRLLTGNGLRTDPKWEDVREVLRDDTEDDTDRARVALDYVYCLRSIEKMT